MESSLFSSLQRKNNKIRVRLQVGEDKQGRKEEEQRGKGTVLGSQTWWDTKAVSTGNDWTCYGVKYELSEHYKDVY